MSTDPHATHTFSGPGTYTVQLTVTDNKGATTTTSQAIVVSANKPPVASFTWAVAADANKTWNRVDFDASASTDPDGTIVKYDWDFQQSAFSSTSPKAPGYIYNTAGTFIVKLTVTDNLGATGTVTNLVTVAAQPVANQPPVASFIWTATNLKVNFDASASTDPDGSIVRYDWDFQQSTFSSTTPTAPGYVYNSGGTYTVKLTVTDDKGATGTTTKQVSVTDAPVVSSTAAQKSPWTTGTVREGLPSNVPIVRAGTLLPSGSQMDLHVLMNKLTSDAVIDISGEHCVITKFPSTGTFAAYGPHCIGLVGGINNGVFDNSVTMQPNLMSPAVLSSIQSQAPGATSQYVALAFPQGKTFYIMGVHFIGADQGTIHDSTTAGGGNSATYGTTPARYKGIDIGLAGAGTIFQNCLMEGFNCADGHNPPYEVGQVDSRRSSGLTVRRVEMSGILPVGSPSRPTSSTVDPYGFGWKRSGGFQWNADKSPRMVDFSLHDTLSSGLTYSIASTSNGSTNNTQDISGTRIYCANNGAQPSGSSFSCINLEVVLAPVLFDHPTLYSAGGYHITIANNSGFGTVVPDIPSNQFRIIEPIWSGGPAGAMLAIRINGTATSGQHSWPTVIKNGVQLIGTTSTGMDPTKYYYGRTG